MKLYALALAFFAAAPAFADDLDDAWQACHKHEVTKPTDSRPGHAAANITTYDDDDIAMACMATKNRIVDRNLRKAREGSAPTAPRPKPDLDKINHALQGKVSQ